MLSCRGKEARAKPLAKDDGGDDGRNSDEEPEYIVEKIMGHRSDVHGKSEYLVKWQGYPLEEDGWEPQDNLQDCKALDVFERKRGKSKK